MDLTGSLIKNTYGNLLTIGSTAGTPTTGTLQNGAGQDVSQLTLNGSPQIIGSGGYVLRIYGGGQSWLNNFNVVGTIGFGPAFTSDTFLTRDGVSNTLAQRNSTNAQTFNLYNTYTDGSNYERGYMKWDTNVLKIGTEALGTGALRAVEFNTHTDNDKTLVFNNNNAGRNGKLYLKANPSSDNYFLFQTSNTQFIFNGQQINIGSNTGIHFRMSTDTGRTCYGLASNFPLSSVSHQFRSVASADVAFAVQGIASQTGDLQQWVDSSDTVLASVLAGGSFELAEITAPATPSANKCRIYAKDNGSGKTQLVVLMPDGVETVLATES